MAQQSVLSKHEWQKLKQHREAEKIIPKREGSDWKGLVFKPRDVNFSTQNENETVYILVRRHFLSNFDWIFNVAIMSVLPLVVAGVLDFLNVNLIELVEGRLILIGVALYYSLLLTSFVKNFADWYFNLYIVTDERVLDYDFVPFVSKGVAESTLSGIEDVKEVSVGFLPSLFNYGDVSMYSEADQNVIIFDQVPNPMVVRDKVADLAKIAKQDLYE